MPGKRKANELDSSPADNRRRPKNAKKTSPSAAATSEPVLQNYAVSAILPHERDDATAAGFYTNIAPLAKGFEWNYKVESPPHLKPWSQIRKYRNVKFGDEMFSAGDIVYVCNRDNIPNPPPDDAPDKKHVEYESKNFWVAQIVEARANSDKEVWVLVAWLYWPAELPVKWWMQAYGQGETVLSNSFDIIDAMTISCRAQDLVFYDEFNDLVVGQVASRFWRQTFDTRTPPALSKFNLSALRGFCQCGSAHNPDSKMYRCSNTNCGQWLHEDCIKSDILRRLKDPFKQGRLDQYAAENSPRSTESFASRLMQPVHAVGRLLGNHVEAGSERNGHFTSMDATTTILERDGDRKSSVMSTDPARPIATKPLQPKNRKLQNEPLQIKIVAEDGLPLYASASKKQSKDKTWDVAIKCLCCDKVMN